jgi:hypothetical protein
MPVQIQSGTSSSALTIDPVSKAARVTLYTTDGSPLHPQDAYRGIVSISVRQLLTSGAAQGSAVWAIHNVTGTKTINIKQVQIQMFFDGTAAATLMKYEFVKATGVTSLTGGTAVVPLAKKTSISTTAAAKVMVFDGSANLSAPGAIYGGVMCPLVSGRVTQTALSFSSTLSTMSFENFREFPIELAANEMLALRPSAGWTGTVIGDNIVGYVEFSET